MLELWGNSEEVLYPVSNQSGEIPREGVINYASPISADLESGNIEIDGTEDLKTIKNAILDFQESRYKGINFLNLEEGEKQTIEFRLPNGTINPNVWIENINLFGGTIVASQELSLIQAKPEEERTPEEKSKLAVFEKLIVNPDLTPEEKLEIILELTIPEENRELYRERYSVNSELINQAGEFQERLKKKTAKHQVKLGKNAIGKACFTGEKPVGGEEMAS